MSYFYVGHDEDRGFFIEPQNAYYVGIFFEAEGSVNLSDFKLVEGECISGGSSKICPLAGGCLYDILYADPIKIEGAEYLGVGPISLPPTRFRGPYLVNQFLIFKKGYLKIHVNKSMCVEIRPHPVEEKKRDRGLRFKEGEIFVGDEVGAHVGYEIVYGIVTRVMVNSTTGEIMSITIMDDHEVYRPIPNGWFFKLQTRDPHQGRLSPGAAHRDRWIYLPNDPDGKYHYGDTVELPGGDIGICEGVFVRPLPISNDPNNLWVMVVVRYCSDGKVVNHDECIVKVIRKNCPKFRCPCYPCYPLLWDKESVKL